MADAEIIYPLKQVLEVKERRVENQEKVVLEKKLLLEKEQKLLEEKKMALKKVQDHYFAKLDQMRKEMDHGTTSPKIQQMKAYLKIVKERRTSEEKKVDDQKKQVDAAEKTLEIAKNELRIKRQEVDKVLTHRRDWLKEALKEQDIVEGREQDELGTQIFSLHARLIKKRS